jgi:hypothetical protein
VKNSDSLTIERPIFMTYFECAMAGDYYPADQFHTLSKAKSGPGMAAVQAVGCAPMVRAFEDGSEHASRVKKACCYVPKELRLMPPKAESWRWSRDEKRSRGAIQLRDRTEVSAATGHARARSLRADRLRKPAIKV